MFGGVGIYAAELFFALLDDDTMYFKVDDATRAQFVGRGMAPFRPYGEGGEVRQYYEAPAESPQPVKQPSAARQLASFLSGEEQVSVGSGSPRGSLYDS